MDAPSTDQMIRFGPLTFRPIKGKNQTAVAAYFVLHSNFEMVTAHVVTRMIFHSITADQNARIRLLQSLVSGKSVETFHQTSQR